MKVLLTGAGGFIGSHVAQRLAGTGHEVLAMLMPDESAARLGEVADALTIGRCNLGRCNLADRNAVEESVADWQADAAVHLAWYAVPGKYWSAAENIDHADYTMRFLATLTRHGCRRFVGVGSCAEYDWSHEWLHEDRTPCVPRTLYGAAKHAVYLMAYRYCQLKGISFAWARLGFTFGPREAPGRLVSDVARGLVVGEDVECTSGEQERDFLYVEDMASAIASLLESDVRGAVNVASGSVVRVREIVARLSAIIGGSGRPLLGARQSDPGGAQVLRIDTTRLNGEVGWRPDFTLDEGLRSTVDWHRSTQRGGYTREDHG
jgi:nucleoside-diphosphate-sugar epimerase